MPSPLNDAIDDENVDVVVVNVVVEYDLGWGYCYCSDGVD